MEAVTGEVMKEIDNYTCNEITPSIELMEKAGYEIKKALLKKYSPKKVLLLCGSSGNGGDAFVIGRYLLEDGISVDAYLISSKLSPDCNTNKERFKGRIYEELPPLSYDLIIDGLIGFGLKSTLRENYIEVIQKINASKILTISIDIPTGIDATNGISYGAFIEADTCYTIEYPKTGLFLNDGLDSYKALEIIPIGIQKTTHVIQVSTLKDFKNIFPRRLNNTNKGSFGKAAIVAGSYKYPGASYISYHALEQFQMGIGYSYLYVPKDVYELYALRHPEVIVGTLPSIDGHIEYKEEALLPLLKMDSIAIGMGMDISYDLYQAIEYLLKNYKGILIIDADALNTLSKYGVSLLKKKSCQVILTPHLKEMERLSKIKVEQWQKNPFPNALAFAEEYGITLVLKSASTIITNGKDMVISAFGNSALAKGGSGDMLAGILSGLAAYLDIDIYKIASLASYILGRASELIVKSIPAECVSPFDTAHEIKNVIKEIKDE